MILTIYHFNKVKNNQNSDSVKGFTISKDKRIMAYVNHSNKVFRLKHGKNNIMIPGVSDAFSFKDGEEFHIVADMMYMGGFPLPPGLQKPITDWVLGNPLLFVEDTRNF